jgi:hypothetical protein
MVGRMMTHLSSSPNVHILISETCECALTCRLGIKAADEINFADHPKLK